MASEEPPETPAGADVSGEGTARSGATARGGRRTHEEGRILLITNEPRSAVRWQAPILAALVLAAVRLVVPDPFGGLLGFAVAVGAAVVMVRAGRRQEGLSRRLWSMFALAVVLGGAAMLLAPWTDAPVVLLARPLLQVGAYGVGIGAIAVYVAQVGPADTDTWLDAAAVGIAVGMVLFEIVLVPDGSTVVADAHMVQLVAIAIAEAAVLAALARFVLRPAFSATLTVLALAMGSVVALDGVYFGTSGIIGRAVHEAAWYVGYGTWAAAALSPEVEALLAGGREAGRTFLDDVRATYGAVTLHLVCALITVALLVHAVTAPRAIGVALLFVALLSQGVFAGARSFRLIRRLERDVQARVATEEQLRTSEERFRRLAETAPVGIFVTDTSGRVVFENDEWGRVTGREPGASVGTGYADAIHPDDRDEVLAAWEDGVASGRVISMEHRMLRADGAVAWVSVRAVPVAGGPAHPSGWIGTVADITGLKIATTSAEEREAFFNGLIEQSPIGIGVYGPDGRLLGHNAAKRRIRERIGVGIDVPDVRADAAMTRLGQTEAIQRAYAGELAAQEAAPVSIVPLAADGRSGEGEPVWLRFHWYPLRDAEGRVLAVISFTEDVTEAVEAEVRQRRVGEKLQEAAKLEALGVLAGGIAHDFNNLLVPIIGYVDLALASAPPASTMAADLEAARTAATRAADLARQMLAYSGRSSFAIEPVVLGDLLGEIGDLIGRSTAKGARLRYDFAPDLPPVLADATQLRQVALNLIVNASDALDGRRGEITLRTAMVRLEPDDPHVIQGASVEPGEYVMLEVSDTGKGMDAATLARVFDPFFSTKSRGRGLGLAATMGIVKGHGGTIRVRSAPGEGSTFQVLLRPTDQVGAARSRVPVMLPDEASRAGRVLLVDDEPSVRQIGRRILERAGFEVEEAGDGPEAVERFSADPDRFASVLLDLTLPTVDGLTILRELRAVRPDLPVVLCSGWSAEEVAERLRRLPRTRFLQKPYQGQALVEALSDVVRMPVGEA